MNPQKLLEVWQQHIYAEFVLKDADAAVDTMTDDAYVVLVPVATGAAGKEAVREFYANSFIPQIPTDIASTTISQTIGDNILIEEAIQTFTHDVAMEWMIPGVPPTGKRIELAVVTVIGFREGKVAFERLYWDQASVLRQLGVLHAGTPAVVGVESAQRVLELTKGAASAASAG